MKSCTCASLDSPIEASRPSFQNSDEPGKGALAPRRLVHKSSKLQTTMEIARCRIGNASRQAAPIGYEDFVPQKDWTPIFHAVYHDREGALYHFLHTGVSPDDTEGSGIPLLSIAAACGHFEITKILLEAGASVNAASRDKRETALHVAVKGGRQDIIDLLLEHRVNLEAKTIHTGETALHYAASGSSSLVLVMKLLKCGANHNVRSLKGHTPAAAALQAHNLHAAVAIINMARGKPKQLAKEKDLLLQHMEQMKDRSSMNDDLIADVFAATCDPDSTVLIDAIKKNDARLVEMFLEKGADPHRTSASGQLPIFVAVKFADLRIIKLLVRHGADVTVRGPGNLDTLQVLFKASSTRDEDSFVNIVNYLLAKGADGLALYSDGKTLLHRTVNGSMDRAKVVKFLLRNGLDLDAKDSGGNTALHLAAHNGLRDAAKAMIDARADTTIVDSTKRTPLLRAVLKQQWALVQMLAFPPAMTSWDAQGLTALHHIVRSIPRDDGTWQDIAAAAKSFCERAVCRSMRDRLGATPLIQAIRTLPDEGLPVIQTLLAEGDQKWNCVGHEDHKGRTALYYAAVLGKTVFVEVLLEHGAPFALEEWTDSKRELKLPAAFKHRILELLIESDRSREALKSQKHRSPIRETRIEIVRTEPRTTSALSGYGADCETERASKSNRNTPRKAPSAEYLHIPAQQRKRVAPSVTFPTRTTSRQQWSHGFTENHHRTAYGLPAVLDRTANAHTGASQCSHRNDQRVEATKRPPPRQVSRTNAKFPPAVSSTQHIMALPTPVPSVLNAATEGHETVIPQKGVEASPTLPAKNIIKTGKVETPTKVSQVPLKPFQMLAQSMPPITQVVAANSPKSATASWSSAKTSTTPGTYAVRVAAEPAEPSSLREPSPAASNIPANGKPVQPSRMDSGASMTQDITTKALPTLDRSKPTLNGRTPEPKRQSGDVLASWLDITSKLDKL